MVIPTWLIELLTDTKTFSVPLAQKIGIEESFLFSFLLYKYADCEFDFVDTFSSKYGIKDIKSCISKLETYKLIETKLDGRIKLLPQNLEIILCGEITTLDNEYEKLISEYIKMCKIKGRTFTRANVLGKLEGFTTDEAKESLRYSLSQKFVTLYKHEKNSGTGGGNWRRISESVQDTTKGRSLRSEEI